MSDYLFANPSFIDGFISVIDLFGINQNYNSSENEAIADSQALSADAIAVKKDFENAYKSMVAAYV